jgi:RND family efflux transporter MFP subunit
MKASRMQIAVWSLVAIGIAAIGVSVATDAADTPRADPARGAASAPRPALTVSVDRPRSATLGVGLTANGNVAAWQEAIIGTEANGVRLADVRVNVGDVVKRGQVLATFAPQTMQAELAQIRAGVAEAEASAADAEANAERARSLRATGALSEAQINQYLTAAQTARARLAAQRAAAQVQELRVAQTRVLAPDDGVISARSATVGAVLPAGQELFRMIRQGRLEWRAEVASAELGRIHPGVKASVVGPSGGSVEGTVRMVAPTVDPQTRSGLVYVDLPTAGASAAGLKAGMFAHGEFELGTRDALTVAQQSIVVRDGFSYVFRMNPDGRVTQLKVQTGRRSGDRIEVVSGVPADAVLVSSGAGFLNDGDLVRVAPAPGAAAPSARAS